MNGIVNEIYYDNFNTVILKNPFDHSIYKFFSNEICKNIIENIKKIQILLITTDNLSQSRFKINLKGNTKDGFDNKNFINLIKDIEPLNTVVKEYEKKIPELLYKKYNNIQKDIIHLI
jgi:hypothetical protein